MKKMKKFASLVLTAALAVTCFAGCGSNDNSSKSGSSADSTAESGTVFKIGGIGPLTRRRRSVWSGGSKGCAAGSRGD